MARIFECLCAAGVALGVAVCDVHAQGFPTKPVKLIVPTPSGTPPDVIGRLAGDRLTKLYGQSFFVENITGAGGLIASRTAARAAPDGYTLYLAGTGALITDRYTVKALNYDPDRDFVLIAMVYEEGSLAIGAHPDLPVKNLPQLIALAKAQPGKLSYGLTSVALVELFGKWLQKSAGIDMLAVPYKSLAQAIQDAIAGRTQLLITAPPQLEPYSKAGKLRVLAVDGSRRNPLMPDVPNISETLPGFNISAMTIMVAPTGTSDAIVQALNRAMDRVVGDEDYVQRLLAMGFVVNGAGTPKSIAEFLRKRREYWDQIMKALNVQPE